MSQFHAECRCQSRKCSPICLARRTPCMAVDTWCDKRLPFVVRIIINEILLIMCIFMNKLCWSVGWQCVRVWFDGFHLSLSISFYEVRAVGKTICACIHLLFSLSQFYLHFIWSNQTRNTTVADFDHPILVEHESEKKKKKKKKNRSHHTISIMFNHNFRYWILFGSQHILVGTRFWSESWLLRIIWWFVHSGSTLKSIQV